MSLGRLKCKDNNAAYVKRIMPETFRGRTHLQIILCIYSSIFTSISSHKKLDT